MGGVQVFALMDRLDGRFFGRMKGRSGLTYGVEVVEAFASGL